MKKTFNSRRKILKKFDSSLLIIYPVNSQLSVANITINKNAYEDKEFITLIQVNHKENFDIVIISCDTSKNYQY